MLQDHINGFPVVPPLSRRGDPVWWFGDLYDHMNDFWPRVRHLRLGNVQSEARSVVLPPEFVLRLLVRRQPHHLEPDHSTPLSSVLWITERLPIWRRTGRAMSLARPPDAQSRSAGYNGHTLRMFRRRFSAEPRSRYRPSVSARRQ